LLTGLNRFLPLSVSDGFGQMIMVNIILLLYLFFISFLVGERLLGWLRIRAVSFPEKALFAFGLGLGVLAYGTYLLGLLGILYRPVLWILIISLSLLFARNAYSYFVLIYAKLSEHFRNKSFKHIDAFSRLLLSLIFLHFILNLVGALAPEIGFDALWYHLALPKLYLTSHRVYFVPHINLSGYPRVMEMLFTLGLGVSGEQLARLIHFATGALSAAGIFIAGKRFFSFASAVVATVIFYAMQPINMLSATADIDLGLTLFGLLGLLALLNAIESKQTRWLLLGGLFAGLAASTKYQGALIVAALAFSLLFYSLRRESSTAKWKASGVLAFSLAALFVFLPWPIDNFINTGNPVYPLLNKLFGVGESWEQVVLSSHTTKSWFQDHTFTAFLTLPWKLITGRCDGWVTPLLLLLAPWGVFLKRKHWAFSFLLVFSMLLYTLLFLLPYWIVRFFVPLLPALSLVAAYTWHELGRLDRVLHRTLNLAIIFVVFANLGFLFMKNVPVLPVALGLEPRENYLSRTLGWYDVNRFVRENLPPKSKVLVYGAQLFYYFDFDYAYDEPVGGQSTFETARELREKNIDYVLLLVDKGGPQDLWNIKGFKDPKMTDYFRLIYTKAMPNPQRTNAARGAKLYAINYSGR